MDLLYTLRRKHIVSNKSLTDFDCLHEGTSLCCISIKNVVAFTTRTELEDTTGKTYGSHVYVSDLNTPWHSHKVMSSTGVVTAIEWDAPGEKLMVATGSGHVSIWTMREYVLNVWTCLGSAVLHGESIVGAAFFHNGRKICIASDKKDSVLYSERMAQVKFAPSVRQFGGCGGEGVVVMTNTGMVSALGLPKEGSTPGRLIAASESLATTRTSLAAVDISYGKNGQLVVAASDGDLYRVQCFRVSVRHSDDRLHVASHAFPSFFLHSFKAHSHHTIGRVTGLKFAVREDADSLVVAANTGSGGVVEVWQLSERPVALHRVFQPPQSPQPQQDDQLFKTVVWQYECSYTTQQEITAVSACKQALGGSNSYVVVATGDGGVIALTRDSLRLVGTACLAMSPTWSPRGLAPRATALDVTWLSCGLVVVDSHAQLYLFKLPPILEPGVGMTVNVASCLLEYCLVTGCDSWDVLISLRPSLVEAVADRLVDNFARQPLHTQQFYYVSHLAQRIALARLTQTGQTRASDLSALLMLHSVSTAFVSLLRPSDLSTHDKGPAESLASVMGDSVTDVDKVLILMEGKEFTVEPSTLQSLQQLIQWTADLALNLLARVPEQYKTPACDLLRDYKALNTLRQLLVIMRVWGLLRPSCLPLFVRSAENLDVLALLFKLLSKFVQSHEPDDALIDDCCLLPSQVMIPQMNPSTPTVCVASPALPYQSLPIQLEYNVEPECLTYEPEVIVVEGALTTDQSVDTIRHIYLGRQPSLVKQCVRCGGKSQAQNTTRTAAIRAWDLRWLRSCRCGGLWRIHNTL